jgi:RimJ/RimL family protein N-acetyltransferase
MPTTHHSPWIATDRLALRELTFDDAWRVADLANDYEVARMLLPLPHPYGLRDAEAFIQRMRTADPRVDRAFGLQHESFGLIGVLGFHRPDGRITEMGYWLGRTFWGCGLATEAARAALAWAFGDWGKRAIMASHFTDNPASGRVLSKAGFLYTGEVRALRSVARAAEAPARMMVCMA